MDHINYYARFNHNGMITTLLPKTDGNAITNKPSSWLLRTVPLVVHTVGITSLLHPVSQSGILPAVAA